jgi:ATP dependent DNA ligase C terminal region
MRSLTPNLEFRAYHRQWGNFGAFAYTSLTRSRRSAPYCQSDDLLQNRRSAESGIVCYAFGILVHEGRRLLTELPEPVAGRWGQGLTAEKMMECVWVRPEVVAEIQFMEWTGADHLRPTKFAGFREDKEPSKVTKES